MNQGRRTFLKMIVIGSGALLVEKIFGPLLSKFLDDSSASRSLLTRANSDTFQVIEDKHILSIKDEAGEEIFQIDKEA